MKIKDNRSKGQNVRIDYADLKPARVRYTSKWPWYRAGKYFFAACPCCGEVILFRVVTPRRSDIVNPEDVPAEVMPKGDGSPLNSVSGNPVSRCKKCGKFFFNQYVCEASHFRKEHRGLSGIARKVLAPGLVMAGIFFVFVIADAAGFRGWNLLDLLSANASENQKAFLGDVVVSAIVILGLFVTLVATDISYSLNDTWGHKGVQVDPADPEYLKFLLRIGHPVPQQYLDALREPPEDADKVSPQERNFAELSSGRRLYRKRNGHCSCCGLELSTTQGFPARLGQAVRVCPGCKNEYFDADFWELSREAYPEKTYARIRREDGEGRGGLKMLLGYGLLVIAGIYFSMVQKALFFSDEHPLFSADPPYNEIGVVAATAFLVFVLWVIWKVKGEWFKAFLEVAYPKSKFQEHLKESEERLWDSHYAECYDLGRKMLSGKDVPEEVADHSGTA
ncbi:hypothetical protein [Succinimonas sp.]|uniref:hypothetical protein n=1 Tax=Succinimonas sp. TaxID=1936151 RepID=UPI00386E5F3E